MSLPYQVLFSIFKVSLNSLNAMSPFLTCFVRPLQEFVGVYSKLDAPPLSGHAGISPATQLGGNSLQDYPSFAGETVGTRIDRDNSLIMPLRLRGGCATECHAFSYYTSSSALIFSPPCGSCSVFEVAHTVYKYALNKCSFIHLRALHAKHQASTRTELRFEFLPLSF